MGATDLVTNAISPALSLLKLHTSLHYNYPSWCHLLGDRS
uniref:Uncharacterized protein n=1 Tax=Anguilla anguilla TaxID=7936 RepID=A0A0E9UDV0_ANGAN